MSSPPRPVSSKYDTVTYAPFPSSRPTGADVSSEHDDNVDSTHGLIKIPSSSASAIIGSDVPGLAGEDIEDPCILNGEDFSEQQYTEARRDRRNSTTANFLFAPQGIEYASAFPVLLSTHLIFFKISDYIDLERTRPDHFFFIFYSMESFCDVALAFFILVTEIVVMSHVFIELRQSCLNDYQPSGIWMAVILCALHAANVTTVAFLKAIPFELIGTNPKKVELLIEKIEESRRRRLDLFTAVSYQMHTQSVVPRTVDIAVGGEEAGSASVTGAQSSYFAWYTVKTYIMHGLSYGYLYGVMVVLQINNILLLLVVGTLLGSASSFRELVTSFISVELITHVHEVVPVALKLRDKSPSKFNKSGLELESELEAKHILPYGTIVHPGPDGKGGVYRWSARMHKNIIFWFFFALIFVLFLIMSSICSREDQKGEGYY